MTRDSEGKFLPGTSGNPAGRPKGRKSQIDELKQNLEIAVRTGLRSDRVVKIVDKMCELAEGGDVRAARLILSLAVSPANTQGEAADERGAITIVIENATFAAKAAQPVPIEAHIVDGEKNVD